MWAPHDRLVLDLLGDTLLGKKRGETSGQHGRVIVDPQVQAGAGVWTDMNGVGHVCIHIVDPQINSGERRIFVIAKVQALHIAEALKRAAASVSV